ncbi:MAG: bifunctional adenosylcobinamide kinase/adenosylcobinamide-phosphate guanylyltransferase [Pseudomonadota bacterium]
MSITFVLGGARSGKSRFAETQADLWLERQPEGERIYVATAQVFDDEMQARVAQHRAQRGDRWRTIEEPLELVEVLSREAASDRLILIDCITLWLTNILLDESRTGSDPLSEASKLETLLPTLPGTLIIVSNEVGLGIVPDNALARRFRDVQGMTNQKLASISTRAVFMAAGLPLELKPSSA